MNQTILNAAKAGITLYPVKRGMRHEWKPGEVGIYATGRDIIHVLILGPVVRVSHRYSYLPAVDSRGNYPSPDPSGLYTVEGYADLCERMSDETVGAQRKVELARIAAGCPFVTPDWWPEFVTNELNRLEEEARHEH